MCVRDGPPFPLVAGAARGDPPIDPRAVDRHGDPGEHHRARDGTYEDLRCDTHVRHPFPKGQDSGHLPGESLLDTGISNSPVLSPR